ncbi:MAG TPA: M24 family metallopeptidase [Chloroflexota bacterium]|nr:M24 family metallopeptidase [Chloroflexota bacterium]
MLASSNNNAGNWDSERLKRERRENLQAEMQRRGIGAALLSEGLNVDYLLGFHIPGGQVFVPREGEAIAMVRPRDAGYVALKHPAVAGTNYKPTEAFLPDYARRVAKFVDGIKALMEANGATGQSLAVDEMEVTCLLGLDRAGVELVNSLPLVEVARSVKTQDEIAIYRDLGAKYAHVFTVFRDNVKPGVTERELEALVLDAWSDVGGDGILQINVCAGENMNPWRRWATDRPLREGEFVGIDFHGRVAHSLLGDASRTYVVGAKPTEAQRELYRRAWEYVQAVGDCVRAGRTHAEVLELIPPVPSEFQHQQDNYHVVHAVGIVPQGYPKVDRLGIQIDDTFKENQILSIECFFGEEGGDVAVKLEEMIRVTQGPPEFITGAVPYEESIIKAER